MQWQLILETTMHAFDINVLLTDRDQQTYGSDRKRTQILFSQCKNDQCDSKNTHAAVPEKLTIFFFGLLTYISASLTKISCDIVIICAETFKMDVTVFIGNKRHIVTY